jgi:nicotinate-nucleotide--dimethylbenzimidazole phosphoribosyltransferase
LASLQDALTRLVPVDEAASEAADRHQARLTKPPGALGGIETLGSQLAAIAGCAPPPIPRRPVVVIFAGDHGVLAEGVSPWPAEVTAQMVANFLAGGAAINAIAHEVGAAIVAVDVGVATPVPGPTERLVKANVRRGTGNIATEPAMTLGEARRAMQVGLSIADRLVDQGHDLLVTGDMGIGNTTPSAAVVAAVTGWPARSVTGRGTGISDEMLEVKAAVVERALERVADSRSVSATALAALDADVILAELGGLEIAGIVGLCIGGALRRVPVVIDGVISLAGALVATALAPEVAGYLVAGHRSVEPGATAALEHIGLEPLLDLQLRLGEGTGACLAIPLVRAAARVLHEMATFESAGVSGSTESAVEPEQAEQPEQPEQLGEPLSGPEPEGESSALE